MKISFLFLATFQFVAGKLNYVTNERMNTKKPTQRLGDKPPVEDAPPHAFPYAVAIEEKTTPDGDWLVIKAGVIVNPRVVITASSIYNNLSCDFTFRVIAGAHNLTNNQQEPTQQRIEACYMYFWEREMERGDTFLFLYLKEDLKYNEYVQPAKLMPYKKYFSPGTNCTVVSWFTSANSGLNPTVTRQYKTEILDNFDTETALLEAYPHNVCGDGGSPIICDDNYAYALFGFWCANVVYGIPFYDFDPDKFMEVTKIAESLKECSASPKG